MKHIETYSNSVVVIPAYNEELSIQRVVKNILKYTRVIVVDDGSNDKTAAIAKNEGCEVVIHNFNKGYDQAITSGMQKALELGFDYAITMDADGQHNPDTITSFINEFDKGADLVIGIRNKRQRIAESIFAKVSRMLWGIKDPLCGMKGYRLSLVKLAGKFDSYGSIGTELTIRAAKAGFKIHQVPVDMFERKGAPRFGNGIRPNLKIMRALFYALINSPLK